MTAYTLSVSMCELVVIDTSVLVSALLSDGGTSRQILRMCFQGELQPVIGNALFSEYESLVERESVFAKSILSLKERQDFLDDFLSTCKWTNIYYLWRPNLRDEADNHLIELAVAGGATSIITGNIRDFKGSDLAFPNIEITTAYDFIKPKETATWQR